MKIAYSVAEYAAPPSTVEGPPPTGCLCAHDGSLHTGIARLQLAKTHADVVVVTSSSPAAFGPVEDYARYPRPLEMIFESRG